MQASFSDLEYDAKKRLTRRYFFLAEIGACAALTICSSSSPAKASHASAKKPSMALIEPVQSCRATSEPKQMDNRTVSTLSQASRPTPNEPSLEEIELFRDDYLARQASGYSLR